MLQTAVLSGFRQFYKAMLIYNSQDISSCNLSFPRTKHGALKAQLLKGQNSTARRLLFHGRAQDVNETFLLLMHSPGSGSPQHVLGHILKYCLNISVRKNPTIQLMAPQCAEFPLYWMKYPAAEVFLTLCIAYQIINTSKKHNTPQKVGAGMGNDNRSPGSRVIFNWA